MALVDTITKFATNPNSVLAIPGSTVDLPKPKLLDEMGVSGLLRTKGTGYIYEEWLRDLGTHRQKQIYREMRDNDAVIGSMFFALEMILRRAEWRVEPAKGGKGEKYAKFITECMDDMSHTWEDFVSECVSMFVFGFSLFETVYKRRKGPGGKRTSKYDDGLIGWRKHAVRAQESILYWMWDDEGGLQGAVQLAAPDYATVPIPIQKLLLFRTTSLKNSPEGRSILRNCYRSWFYKRRIEEVEGIGIERDLCGLPVLYATREAIEAMGGESAARALVRNIRVDDQMGVILPQAFDDKGNPLVKLELLKSSGPKQTDAGSAIQRYNQDMLNTVLAGFIQFGQTPTGSRALHVSASQIFSQAIAAFMDSVSAVMNRYAIPRLMALNNMELDQAPSIKPGEIGIRDLEELTSFIGGLAAAGISFIDRPTTEYLRKIARLPEEPKEGEEGYVPPPGSMPPPGQEGVGPDGKPIPPEDGTTQEAPGADEGVASALQ